MLRIVMAFIIIAVLLFPFDAMGVDIYKLFNSTNIISLNFQVKICSVFDMTISGVILYKQAFSDLHLCFSPQG